MDKSPFEYDSVEISEDKRAVRIIDQTLLPCQERFLTLNTPEEFFEAIVSLRVRGAPAIGVFAAFALAVSAQYIGSERVEVFIKECLRVKNYLITSRPTAVNLMYTLNRMEGWLNHLKERGCNVAEMKELMICEAEMIKEEDVQCCLAIAENGFKLLYKGVRVLTHCNAGHLAVSRYGTALGPVYLAQNRGFAPKVYAGETRPLLQGARLTVFELLKAGVNVELMCDNMASSLMQRGLVDIVFLGADRIAANGDVANKIGTSMIATAAKYWNIPLYVLAPSSTIDQNCACGRDIIIEQRDPYEVTGLYLKNGIVPESVNVYNPAFDVTPRELITGIITENGIM